MQLETGLKLRQRIFDHFIIMSAKQQGRKDLAKTGHHKDLNTTSYVTDLKKTWTVP